MTSLETRLTDFKSWLDQSRQNVLPVSSLPFAGAIQRSANLLPGQTIDIPHGADPARTRIVTLLEVLGNDDAQPGPLIPVMSGYSSPECTVSASSVLYYQPQLQPWLAVNGNLARDDAWLSNSEPSAWWRCRFTYAQTVTAYALAGSAWGSPASWEFRAYDEDGKLHVLDQQSDVDWSGVNRRMITLATPASFRDFELYFVRQDAGGHSLSEVQFYGTVTVPVERFIAANPQDYKIVLLDDLTRVTRLTPLPRDDQSLLVTVRL